MQRSPREVAARHSKLRADRLGVSRPDLRGRTGPNRDKKRIASSWEIVMLRADGASLPTIARECGLKLSGADYRVDALDLPPGPYDSGEPFRKRHTRRLWRISGLTYPEFSRQIGISTRSVQADLSPRRSDEYIDSQRARKYLAWRDRVVEALLAGAPSEKGKRVRWGKSSVLKTFFPDLRTMCRLLVETIPAIGDWLRAHPEGDANQLAEWACDQAQAETKRTPRIFRWRKLVRWLPQLMPTLKANWELLKRVPEGRSGFGLRLWQVAHGLLADHFGVSSSILQRSLEQKAPRISSGVLCHLIEDITRSTSQPTVQSEKKRRGPKGPRKLERDKRFFQVSRAVGEAVPRFEKLILVRRHPRKHLLDVGCSEQEIEALHMPGSRTALIAARWFVSLGLGLPFDTVARYDKRARKSTDPGQKLAL